MNIWNSKKLKDLNGIEIILGQSPSSKSYNKKNSGLPFLQGKAEFGMIYPNPKIFTDAPLKIAEGNDLLLSVRAPVGNINLSPYKLCIGRGLAAIRFTKDNPKFYFYWFLKNQKAIENLGVGSTFKAITGEQLKKIEIPVVELSEQTAIANILSTVDEAIQKADEAITKTERIKQAMMQKLFSEGIGHKEFKQTKIGEIPKTWNILRAEEVCLRVTDGTHDSPKAEKKGYLLYTSKNIKDGQLISEGSYYISEIEYNKANKRSIVSTYDVLFSMIGTVGENAIVIDEPVKFAVKNVGLFKTNNDLDLASWLHYYFYSQMAQRYVVGNSKGTTQKYITLEALRNFPVLIPEKTERDRIVTILKHVDDRLNLCKRRKFYFNRIKHCLMNDLLTGIKRVKTN